MTASAIRLTGWPSSNPYTAVHRPVPFWPAASRISSSVDVPSGDDVERMSAVISIRNDSSRPSFQPAKASDISAFDMPFATMRS